jgi:hypothetical protein
MKSGTVQRSCSVPDPSATRADWRASACRIDCCFKGRAIGKYCHARTSFELIEERIRSFFRNAMQIVINRAEHVLTPSTHRRYHSASQPDSVLESKITSQLFLSHPTCSVLEQRSREIKFSSDISTQQLSPEFRFADHNSLPSASLSSHLLSAQR